MTSGAFSERYSRQTILPEVGASGQAALLRSRVLLVGAGGLSSPAALYLAAAGVGHLTLIDDDEVALSNLQRQILYSDADVGRKKVNAAADRLRAQNADVTVHTAAVRMTAQNAESLIADHDVVIDGSDNFATKYVVADACQAAAIPLVYGAVLRFEGQVAVFSSEDGPSYRDLFPQPPPAGSAPDCAEAGVLGVLPGIVGSLQALEAIKILLGHGSSLSGRLLLIDAMSLRFRTVDFRSSAAESANAKSPIPHITQPKSMPVPEITVTELKARLDAGDRPFILDVRRDEEYEIANLNGELIPLDQLLTRLDELDAHKDELVIVHCRTGGRSAQAVELLRAHGFTNAVNLRGGTHAWSDEVDPDMPKY
ncbi:molybdopterin-synthase adenylyltransferase MoeB [soil metagenome]